MTKIKLLLLLSFFVQLTVNAQVKIGDNPNTINGGSLLELETTNKGFVFPRVALTALSSPSPLPAGILTGTVVFNTASAVGTGVGLYFWSGTAWVAIGSGTLGNGWLTGGNDNTTVNTNSFLGTTASTAIPLLFKAQGDTVGYLGLKATTNSVSFGVSASGANTATKAVAIGPGATASAGNEAVALGSNAVAGSFQDIAIGANSQTATSSSNIAIGSGAQATSSNAIAIGSGAQATTNQIALAFGVSAQATGFTSMAIGNGAKSTNTNTTAYGALAVASGVSANAFGNRSNATGDSSLAVGNNSKSSGLNSVVLGTGSSASGPYSLILGSHSSSTADSVIIIGNNLTTTASNVVILGGVTKKIGMGTTTPQEKVDIVGNVRFTGALMPNGTAGTTGQVLTSGGANNPPTWLPATSLTSFSVTPPLTYNNTTGVFGITQANGTGGNGYLSSGDWTTFNNKVGSITLNTPSVIYTNPINFSVVNGAATGTLSLIDQNPNTVLAGPALVKGQPGFRALVAADIPSLAGLYIQNQTAQQASSSFNISGNGTIGTNLTVTGTSTLTGPVTSKAGIINTGAITSSGGILSVTQSNPLFLSGVQPTSSFTTDSILTILNGVVKKAPNSSLPGNNAWSLTGNSGTDTTSNFLGTIDNKYMLLKTNSKTAMTISPGGNVNIGMPSNLLTNYALGVANTMELKNTFATGTSKPATISQLLFTNSNGINGADMRMANDGSDFIFQGGGGRNTQWATWWTMVLMGDRQVGTPVTYTYGNNGSDPQLNTGVLVKGQRDVSVPLAVQANSATQTANLTEWRDASSTIGKTLSVVDKSGNFGIGITVPPNKLSVLGTNPLYLSGLQGAGASDSILTILNGVVRGAPASALVASAWSIKGNTGLNTSTNFLGTTDSVDLALRTANVDRLHIMGRTVVNGSYTSYPGWVGIGTSAPRSRLDVTGSYAGKNALTIQNTSSQGYSSVDMYDNTGNNLSGTFGFANSGVTNGPIANRDYFFLYTHDFIVVSNGAGAGNPDFFIEGTNGNVGINDSTPTEKLDVKGNVRFSGALMPNNSAGTTGQVLTSGGTNAPPTWKNVGGGSGTSFAINSGGNISVNGNTETPFTFNYSPNNLVTRSTVLITPSSDLPTGVGVEWARVIGSNQIKVIFRNYTGTNQSINQQDFYFTVTTVP
jgi:hypothetical protein